MGPFTARAGRVSSIRAITSALGDAAHQMTPPRGRVFDQTWSIALFGTFNPGIFQPDWLIEHKAGPAAALQTAVVLHEEPTHTSFEAGTFTLEVTLERLLLQGEPSSADVLWPLLETTFSILTHTPVSSAACGLDAEYEPGDRDEHDALLGQFFRSDAWESHAGAPSEVSLTVKVPPLDGGTSRYITIEDSSESPNGLYVSVVEQLAPVPPPRPPQGASVILQGVGEVWAAFRSEAEARLHQILAMG